MFDDLDAGCSLVIIIQPVPIGSDCCNNLGKQNNSTEMIKINCSSPKKETQLKCQ
jgi:hypothetical protein